MQKQITLIGFLFLITLILVACSSGPMEYGTLEGTVTIGPLVPVLREGELPPTPAPEVFAARQIVVYKKDGVTEYTRLKIDPNGKYNAQLPVGTFVVDINRIGIDSADNLPREIQINPNQVTKLDIDIDTGIR